MISRAMQISAPYYRLKGGLIMKLEDLFSYTIPEAFDTAVSIMKEKNNRRSEGKKLNMSAFKLNKDEGIWIGFFKHKESSVNRVENAREVARMSQLCEGYGIDFCLNTLNSIDDVSWQSFSKTYPEFKDVTDENVRIFIYVMLGIFHELQHVWQAEIQLQLYKTDWRTAYYLEEKEQGGYWKNRFEIGAYNFETNALPLIRKYVIDGKFVDSIVA